MNDANNGTPYWGEKVKLLGREGQIIVIGFVSALE